MYCTCTVYSTFESSGSRSLNLVALHACASRATSSTSGSTLVSLGTRPHRHRAPWVVPLLATISTHRDPRPMFTSRGATSSTRGFNRHFFFRLLSLTAHPTGNNNLQYSKYSYFLLDHRDNNTCTRSYSFTMILYCSALACTVH